MHIIIDEVGLQHARHWLVGFPQPLSHPWLPIARRATNRLNYSLDSSSLSFFFLTPSTHADGMFRVACILHSFLTRRPSPFFHSRLSLSLSLYHLMTVQLFILRSLIYIALFPLWSSSSSSLVFSYGFLCIAYVLTQTACRSRIG